MKYIDDVKKPIDDWFSKFFIFTMLFGAFPTIVIFLIVLFNFRKLRIFLHCSWCLTGFFAIVSALLCVFMFPFVIIMMDFC